MTHNADPQGSSERLKLRRHGQSREQKRRTAAPARVPSGTGTHRTPARTHRPPQRRDPTRPDPPPYPVRSDPRPPPAKPLLPPSRRAPPPQLPHRAPSGSPARTADRRSRAKFHGRTPRRRTRNEARYPALLPLPGVAGPLLSVPPDSPAAPAPVQASAPVQAPAPRVRHSSICRGRKGAPSQRSAAGRCRADRWQEAAAIAELIAGARALFESERPRDLPAGLRVRPGAAARSAEGAARSAVSAGVEGCGGAAGGGSDLTWLQSPVRAGLPGSVRSWSRRAGVSAVLFVSLVRECLETVLLRSDVLPNRRWGTLSHKAAFQCSRHH